jgi:hypothetical protein
MSHPYQTTFACVLILAGIAKDASADGYDLFSKHEELKAHVVVDAGDFEKIDPPFGKLGASQVLKLNSNCFQPSGSLGVLGYGKKAGLVLVDRNKILRIALLESSIGSIKVETALVLQVACPTHDSSGLPLDPQQRLQELKRQQEVLQLQLERLRQQQQQQK